MTDVTLVGAPELGPLLSRIDGDADISMFSIFELVLLLSHLKQTGQMEFMSDWYNEQFTRLQRDGVLDNDGNLQFSVLSIYWSSLASPLYRRPDRAEGEGF